MSDNDPNDPGNYGRCPECGKKITEEQYRRGVDTSSCAALDRILRERLYEK